MKHLKNCIILLLFILFVTCFLLSDIEAMDDQVVTVKQLSKLSTILVDIKEENADSIIKYVNGLRLNNPYFTSILKDKYLTNYGKCIFLKEINDFVISNSVTQNDNVKNSFKQAVISNDKEIIDDDIIIKKATLIDDILDGTMPDNADKSINAINGLNLEDTIIKSIIDIYELSDYNKILIIKQIMNLLINNSGVKGDEMDKTWIQSLGVPLETVARQKRTPPPRWEVPLLKNCGSVESCSATVEPGWKEFSSEVDMAVTGTGVTMPSVLRIRVPVTWISST